VKNSRLAPIATAYAQLPQYFLIGILSVAANLFVFWIVSFATENIYLSTLIGNLASIVVNFTGLRKIFNSTSFTPSVIKYGMSLSFFYFLNVSLTIWFIQFGLDDLISRAITIAILFPFVYLVNKYLVFK
jgi:putative flippase GtrA